MPTFWISGGNGRFPPVSGVVPLYDDCPSAGPATVISSPARASAPTVRLRHRVPCGRGVRGGGDSGRDNFMAFTGRARGYGRCGRRYHGRKARHLRRPVARLNPQ